jgi:hypothetical protein
VIVNPHTRRASGFDGTVALDGWTVTVADDPLTATIASRCTGSGRLPAAFELRGDQPADEGIASPWAWIPAHRALSLGCRAAVGAAPRARGGVRNRPGGECDGSAALDHAQQLNGALANLDEDVQHFGLTALDVLSGHRADDLVAMTASENQVDADFAALARVTGFTAAQEQALPLVTEAWNATISNRDAIRLLGNSVQMDAAAARDVRPTRQPRS